MSRLAFFGAAVLFSTVGLIIACLVAYAVIMKRRHYKCIYCGFRFKTSSVRSFFAKGSGADKLLTCPNCGKSGFMEFKHDDEDAASEKEIELSGKEDIKKKTRTNESSNKYG